jgi:hypothetical protein
METLGMRKTQRRHPMQKIAKLEWSKAAEPADATHWGARQVAPHQQARCLPERGRTSFE